MLRAKEQYTKFLTIKTCFKRADVFVLLEHAKQFFLGRCQLHNQGKGCTKTLAPLTKSFRKFNFKIQAFKRVLDLILGIRGAEGAKQFNSFNDF